MEPVDATHVPAGTHVNFAVSTFPGDDMLKPGTAKVALPAKSPSYCGLAAAASCPLPKGKYTLTTKVVSKTSGNKFTVNQVLTVTSRRG